MSKWKIRSNLFSWKKIINIHFNFDFLLCNSSLQLLKVLDQRQIPAKEIWLPVDSVEQMHEYILTLAVRGAPLIGCAAALSLALHVISSWPKYSQFLSISHPSNKLTQKIVSL
jgi:methylthioribose-1-phosphate isomerase